MAGRWPVVAFGAVLLAGCARDVVVKPIASTFMGEAEDAIAHVREG
jgi:hypothetical protein